MCLCPSERAQTVTLAPYKVYEYSKSNLIHVMSDGAVSIASSAIHDKAHFTYFDQYLREIKAATILVEVEYVDRDFLEDYAAYYSRCFRSYNRFCRRIHFFSKIFTDDDFESALLCKGASVSAVDLKNSYLGFIVARPLPFRLFGRTCLANYPNTDRKTRHFPTNRPYKVNVFGIDLEVSTIAFQEQDREVAACATSALWSVFQATAYRFQHPVLSPVDITRAATKISPGATRSLPNGGLDARQQSDAIRSVGLEPLVISVIDDKGSIDFPKLKAAFYGYNQFGVPAIISAELIVDVIGAKPFGRHAVSGLGYRIGDDPPTSLDANGPKLLATSIDRIYVHDDQAGPFARLRFEADSVRTSWLYKGQPDKILARPKHLIVPLYHKIRVTFLDVYKEVSKFDSTFERFRKSAPDFFKSYFTNRLIWDIHLSDANTVRRSVFNNPSLNIKIRKNTLTKNMPRYIWRATALREGAPVLEILFDATGLSQGTNVFHAVPYEKYIPAMAAGIRQNKLSFVEDGDSAAEIVSSIIDVVT